MGISLLHLGQVRPFSQTTHRFHLAAASLIFLLALSLRLGFIWQTHDIPEFRTPTPGLDIDVHWQAARELRRLDREVPNFALKMASAPGQIAAPVIRAEALRWLDPPVRAWLELDRPGF